MLVFLYKCIFYVFVHKVFISIYGTALVLFLIRFIIDYYIHLQLDASFLEVADLLYIYYCYAFVFFSLLLMSYYYIIIISS